MVCSSHTSSVIFLLQADLTNGLGVFVLGEPALISYPASLIRTGLIVSSFCPCSADIVAETLPSNFSPTTRLPLEP